MRDMRINIAEAEAALTQRPLFSVSAERVFILDEIKSKYNGLPQPLRFSRTLGELLCRVSTPVEPHDLIAGRAVFRELDPQEEALFESFIASPDYPPNDTFLGSGHCTYSWETVVEEGITGLRARAQGTLAALPPEDSDRKIFLQATLELYDAITAYALRYAEEADRQELPVLAQNLRDAVLSAPSHFASALQLLWLITLINCAYITENPTLTVGRLDKLLYPLYRADVDSGILTEDGASELITDYYCKHNLIMGRGEHQLGDETNSTTFKRILNFDAPQYLLLGGVDSSGSIVENELTELFAQNIVPSFKNPVIVVRYVKDMDKRAPRLWSILSGKAVDSSALMFYNDEGVTAAFEKIGLDPSEAREYAHFGCNWCSTGANGAWMVGGPGADKFNKSLPKDQRYVYNRVYAPHGWAEDFMISLRALSQLPPERISIDELYDIFFSRMERCVVEKLENTSRELAHRRARPSAVLTFTDLFLPDSLARAECFSASAKYHFEIQAFQMFGTTVDCFIAVDKLVMREKRLSLERLIEAAEANFEGYGYVLALCRKADKYGMDTALSNMHAARVAQRASELIIEKSRPYFEREGLFLMPSIQSDTWHLKYGEEYGATADGRLAGRAFSQNTNPSAGAAVNGITAMLNSVRCIPKGGFVSGALNLDINKSEFDSENGRRLFGALLSTHLNLGGLHAQVSAAGAETLRAAQEDPQSYRHLRVRVTGYSGVFVDICKRLQDDIIQRFE